MEFKIGSLKKNSMPSFRAPCHSGLIRIKRHYFEIAVILISKRTDK